MGNWVWVALGVANFALALRGVHMLTRPVRYLGPRSYDAHDPRTVRFFGGLQLVGGAIVALLAFFKVAQG